MKRIALILTIIVTTAAVGFAAGNSETSADSDLTDAQRLEQAMMRARESGREFPGPLGRIPEDAEETELSGTVELTIDGSAYLAVADSRYRLVYPRRLAEGIPISHGDEVQVAGLLHESPVGDMVVLVTDVTAGEETWSLGEAVSVYRAAGAGGPVPGAGGRFRGHGGPGGPGGQGGYGGPGRGRF